MERHMIAVSVALAILACGHGHAAVSRQASQEWARQAISSAVETARADIAGKMALWGEEFSNLVSRSSASTRSVAGGTEVSVGGRTLVFEDSTEPALVVQRPSVLALSLGLANGMLFPWDSSTNGWRNGEIVMSTTASLVSVELEDGVGGTNLLFTSSASDASVLVGAEGVRLCQVGFTEIQPSVAERILGR